MFLSIKEMEVRKIRFDETFAPGELDFEEDEIRQAGPLHAAGNGRIAGQYGGRSPHQGRFEVRDGGGM